MNRAQEPSEAFKTGVSVGDQFTKRLDLLSVSVKEFLKIDQNGIV